MAKLDIAALPAEQRRLLVAWRDILDDIRHLCGSLQAMPDTCACGEGRLHLKGLCVCCETAPEHGGVACEDCESLLAKLQPEVNSLTVDTSRFFPIVMDLLESPRQARGPGTPAAIERHIASVARQAAADAIERHIAAVIRAFEQVVAAADEFRGGCRASQLQTLKSAATDLLSEVERLDRAL